jgi:hypothetical protein
MSETYDRICFGHKTINISQIGSGYDGGNHYSHVSYELDLAGEDSGVDVWRNKMPNTLWYCAGAWGTSSTGNTRFFWSYGTDKKPKKVLCADGQLRYITLALTHSNKNFTVGKYYACDEVMYQEGTSGYATGNHIHLEICEGQVKTKVKNSKNGYNLPNMLDATKILWIYDKYSTVKSTCGLTFKHCSEISYTVKSSSSSTSSSSSSYDTSPKYQNKNLAKGKTYTTKVQLNMRSGSSTSAPVKVVIPKGTKLHYYGYYSLNGKQPWVWVQCTVSGKSYTGFVCAKTDYLSGYVA